MRYGVLLLLFILSCGRIRAQEYVVRQYTSDDGLPQNTARDLLLDSDGYLWIATDNGVVRFDGQRFRIYNKENTPAIKPNRISIMFQPPGHPIIATGAYPGSIGYLITPDHDIIADGAGSRNDYKYINDRSGCIFDATSFFTFARNKAPGGPDTVLLHQLSETDSLEIINPHEMVGSLEGEWYDLNNQSGQIVKLPSGLNRPGSRWFCLDGLFGVLTPRQGLRFFRNGIETTLAQDRSAAALIETALISPATDFRVYRKSDLVLVQVKNNIYQLYVDARVLKARLLFKDLDFLTDQAVRCYQYDTLAQRLFIGTANAGLFVVSKKRFHTATFSARDIKNNIIMAFQLLPDSRVLTNHGLLEENPAKSSVVFGEDTAPDLRCIYKAADRSIWFSRNHHLYQYDSLFSRQLFCDTLVLDSYVTSMRQDREHTLWVSLSSSLLKMEKGQLRYLERNSPILASRRIQSMAEVVPGKWWIATNNGLYVYDIAEGRLEDRPLLPGVFVRTIYTAKDGSIWLGTYGDGYYKYTAGKFIALPLDPGQYLSVVHAFLEDGEGFFWITTDHGLFRIKKKELEEDAGTGEHVTFYYFGKSAGLNTDEFNGGCDPSSLVDRKGNFCLPTMDGLVYFNPDSIRSEWPDKPILIDRVTVDSSKINVRQPPMFPPDFKQLTVDVTTPYYGPSANLLLEYKLDRLDDQWYPIRDGRIIINRLPFGKYTLMIRKRKGWQPADFTMSSFSFDVLPKWYSTRWFDILLSGVILLTLLLIYFFRPRILLLQNKRLQVKVEKRTTELEQSTIIKERLISVIMHDLRSPLFAQGFMINYLGENYAKLPPGELGDLLFELNESNKNICQFSTDFLVWYKTRLEGFQLDVYPVAIETIAQEVAGFYRELARRKGLRLSVDIPQGLVLETDRNILAIVLRNLVDNAVKYTPSGFILISVVTEAGAMVLKVQDTGTGMSASKVSELMSYRQVNLHKTSTTYGYRLIAELAQLIGAYLEIRSEPGKGTTIALSFKA